MPGTYVAWIKISYDPNYEKDFEVTLAVYSEYPCSIRLSTREEAIKFSGDADVEWNENKKPLIRESKHLGKTSKKRNVPKDIRMEKKEQVIKNSDPVE